MARAAPQTVASSPQRADDRSLLIGELQRIRALAETLTEDFQPVRTAASLADAIARGAELPRTLQRFAARVGAIAETMAPQLDQADALALTPGNAGWIDFELVRIRQAWIETVGVLQSIDSGAPQADGVLAALTQAEQYLHDEVIYYSALITIPVRLADHLQSVRVGGSVNFDDLFRDELPDPKQRLQILTYIANHPMIIPGVVDIPTGQILRASSRPWRRRESWIGLLGLAFIGGTAYVVAIANVAKLSGISNWPIASGRFQELLIAYAFLIAGTVAHWVVGALKLDRTQQTTPLALDDTLLWIHVHERSLGLGVIAVWITLLALAVAVSPLGWETAFFAGYSIDSIIDLALARFTSVASSQSNAVATLLSAPH